MADFNWYLNRQGLRGLTGEKGDQGFSPYFTVEESTANQYRLRVHNENDSFVTENLRGNAIEIRNPDGNYIKYDHETGDFYVDDADYATVDSEGQVILATINDVVTGNETKAVTPALLLDSLSQILVNTDGNLSIAQNQDNSLTEINLADEVIHPNLKYAQNNNYLITGDIRYNNPIRVTKGILDDTGRRGCTFELMYDTNHFSRGSQGLVLSNSIISFINNTRNDLNSEISNRESAINDLRQEYLRDYSDLGTRIQNESAERSRQDSLLQSQIDSVIGNYVNLTGNQTIDGIKKFTNMIEFNENVSFGKRGGYNGATIIDNHHWLRFERGRLSIGHDDSTGYTTDAYILTQSNLVAGDNITIEESGYGLKISATGGGSGGGDMTTNTDQDVTGVKNFIGSTLKFSDANGNYTNFELKNQTISTPDGYSGISNFLDVGGKTLIGGFAQYRFVFGSTGLRLAYSPCVDMEGLVAGDGVNITKNYGSNTVTISATGGGGAIIDDEDISTTKVFSSSRTSDLIGEVGNDLQDLTQRVNNIESLKVPNVVIIGEPLIQDGQVSGLDQTNHLQFPFILERQGRSWEYNGSFTTGSNITNQQNIIDSKYSIALAVRNSRLVIALSSNGTTFDLGEHTLTDLTIQPNTTYYVKISYIENMGYVLEADVAPITYGSPHLSIGHANTPIAATTMLIGSDGNSFNGTLDLNKWSLKVDEQLVWLGMDNVGQAVSANVSLSNINAAGVKVINDLIDTKIGDINSILDAINGEVI